jgi:hypothetical protein
MRRFKLDCADGKVGLLEDEEGKYVLYADHLAHAHRDLEQSIVRNHHTEKNSEGCPKCGEKDCKQIDGYVNGCSTCGCYFWRGK